MNYVLAYIPFSTEGEQPVKVALTIAKQINATLLIMNSARDRVYAEMAGSEFIAYIQTGYPASESVTIRHITGDDLSPVESGTKIIIGTISLVITSSGQGADQPRSFLQKFKCPVLLANDNCQLDSIRKICYITDLRYCDLSVLRPMIELFRPFGPEWIIVHITNPGLPDLTERYAEVLFRDNIKPAINYTQVALIHLKGESITDDLKNVSEIIEPDMVAIPAGQYNGYASLFRLLEKPAAGYAPMPLLLMN